MSRHPRQPPGPARKPRGRATPPPKSGSKRHAAFVDPHAEREAQRYEHPIASREAILALLEEQGGPLDADTIAEALGIGDAGGDDLYLSPAQMRQVLHGDRALASVVGVDRRGRRQGAIREVLERRPAR